MINLFVFVKSSAARQQAAVLNQNKYNQGYGHLAPDERMMNLMANLLNSIDYGQITNKNYYQ